MTSTQIDFSAPVVAARIVTADGRKFPFWVDLATVPKQRGTAAQSLAGDSLEENDSNLKSLAFLQEVTVEWQLAYIPIINITISPPYRDAIAFLDSELIEWGSSTVEVQIGYAPGGALLSPVFAGVMLKPDVTLGIDCSISINAQGVGAWSLTRHEGVEQSSTETRRQLITKLAKGPGQKKDITVDFTEADNNVASKTALDEPTPFVQGTRNYWQAIEALVDEAQCTLRVSEDSKTISVIALNTMNGAAPRRVFRMFDFPSGRLGFTGSDEGLNSDVGASSDEKSQVIYPIFSLTSPTAAIYLPGAVRGIIMREVDDSTRAPTTKVVDDTSTAPTRNAKTAAAPADSTAMPESTAEGNAGAAMPGDPNKKGDLGAVISAYMREGNMGIELEVETVGVPDLRPGEVVAIEGVGRRLGGNRWVVHKIRHSAGLSGFTTTMSVISNADVLLASGPEARGKVNPGNVEGGSTDSTSVPTTSGQGV